jgi:hypothetical protein
VGPRAEDKPGYLLSTAARTAEEGEDRGESVGRRRARLSLFAASDTWARWFLGGPPCQFMFLFPLSRFFARRGRAGSFGGGRSVWARDRGPLTWAPDLGERARGP